MGVKRGRRAVYTEQQAWDYLARRWTQARISVMVGHRGMAVIRLGRSEVLGLCASVIRLFVNRRISAQTRQAMIAAIRLEVPVGYGWPRTLRGAVSRAAFCRNMTGHPRP